MNSAIDPMRLRDAMGNFITGVTVITCSDSAGNPVGLTANSFSSVSLDPPLCLWSIAKTSKSFPAFNAASHFAVHVLHSGQEKLSRLFSSKVTDRFSELDYELGAGNTPLLKDYSARFECSVNSRYAGGDHLIMVGRILSLDTLGKEPLGFFKGQYKKLASF
jgi:3-hydroxy-9,10-secoandrosta-1,3,5(10)-triene-9,17-dione monooxygenase reductase component